jgi:hypothetical protein
VKFQARPTLALHSALSALHLLYQMRRPVTEDSSTDRGSNEENREFHIRIFTTRARRS